MFKYVAVFQNICCLPSSNITVDFYIFVISRIMATSIIPFYELTANIYQLNAQNVFRLKLLLSLMFALSSQASISNKFVLKYDNLHLNEKF